MTQFYKDLKDVKMILGLDEINGLMVTTNSGYKINISVLCSDSLSATYQIDGRVFKYVSFPKTSIGVHKFLRMSERILNSYGYELFSNCTIASCVDRERIFAAVNTKNLAKDLVRVRSSNVWSYGLNIKNRKDKTGDLLVQFKNKNGGAGDIYIYYDVPVLVYRRWQSAPSKGHYFYVYIRNNYSYSKLTGNKRGTLPNAIN